MTSPKDGTNRASIDRANPNTLGDAARLIALGSLLAGQVPQVKRNQAPVADPYSLASVEAIVLPAHAKGSSIQRAYARATAAAGTLGELTVVAYGVTPGDGEIAVAPNGDIVLLAASAYTDVDVNYLPERCDVIETVFPVVANVLTLPASITSRGVVLLAEAEALEGGSTGRKIVLIPGAGAPAAGQARLNVAKSTVTFAAADAVTRARVKLSVAAAEDLSAILEAPASLI